MKLVRLSQEIDELKSGLLGSLRNRSSIASKQDAADSYKRELVALTLLNESNNKLHAENPDVPRWSHDGSPSTILPHRNMYWLYQEMRDFDLLAGSGIKQSPGHDNASVALSNRLLVEKDRDVLREYFSADLYNDGHDHGPDSEYWNLHRRLDAVISKLPKLDEPVTVWRGENYFPRRSWGDAKQRTLAKIQEVVNLQPGDTFRWEQCAATSTYLPIANSGYFSNPKGKPGEPIRNNFDDFDLTHDPHYSVIFEMETDRGVFIDNDLHRMNQIDENEILLPMNMEYEVVGHSQVRVGDMTGKHDDRSHHVIKLRLRS